MILYQYLLQKEVHCFQVIPHLDMDWQVLIIPLEMDWRVLMVCFLLMLHSHCCMRQVLLQVQRWFQWFYQMAVLYMCNSLQGSSHCLWLRLLHS
uniref:Uncharacterized protein n=1 Tax=Arundo donax TaxID=35708 RepID=A0A0A9DAD0_ARUDO